MKKQKTLGRYEKGIIITGISVLIIFLILLTADGIKNIGKNKQNLALSEQEEVVPPNVPVLSAGMIPVKMMGDNLVICKNDNSWYNYEAGTPAYMMLNDGVYQSELVVDMANKKLASDSLGQVVPKEEQGSIYMWIPRFEISGEDKIKYVKEVNYANDGYEIPEMFTYKQSLETSPDFLLTGIWIEKEPLASTSEVTTKITNMTGENNTYGFIANTIATNAGEGDSPVAAESWLTGTVPNQIADPSNTNRTTLKIINNKYQDPIKAKVEYNKQAGLIEITVTYSKHGINRITFEDTTELTMTNTNGIITANTAGITLEAGTYKISITDKNGTTKKLKVKVPYVYGREVLGYECDVPNVKWRLFHADDQNIYLIADDYIPYANLPTSTNGTALNKGSTNYRASLDSIINDYTGSRWIIENANEQAQKWLSQYLDTHPNGTDTSIKATAYMMDTDSWSTFKGDKAEYAIGGPTIELFCASYKQTHLDRYIEVNNLNGAYGYYIKWSDGSYSNGINGLIKDEYNSIYIKGTNTKASGMWIASPCTSAFDLMQAEYGGYVGAYSYNNSGDGFRPVVCLKSGTKLIDNGDNTYSIKEPIMANIEYKEANGTIEITVQYTENGIAKIEDQNGNSISYTNENGIIKAVVTPEPGTNKFIIIDNKGITKELKVKVPFVYGNKVFGYECEVQGVEWRLFYDDEDNIYLIADDYIPYDNLPTTTENHTLRRGALINCAYLDTNILNDYTGSSWIRENTNPKAQKWLSKYLTTYPDSTNENIKAVAYMMDTNKWSGFAGNKAEYAIGGPTLELFCASYKVTHPSRYIECDSITSNGYQVKWNNGSYSNYIENLKQDDFNSIYIKSDYSNAYGMWLASPSSFSTEINAYAYWSNHIGAYDKGHLKSNGFRPVVCLKSDVKLVDNGDNTYSIKEPITAKAEYKEQTNLIEVRVAYSEHGISKIMLNDTNELPMTNTNEIITANTSGINLEDGIQTLTIVDNKGNTKILEVDFVAPTRYYGKEVTNYTCSASGVDKWRVFHVDDNNIYLIADDYVPYANLPTSTAGTALNKGDTNYKAYFTNILSNYTGSAWIRTNTNAKARNWLSWVNSYPSSTNNNIKAVAYMMDTNKWSGFAGTNAEYAIGGPTLELFCASYKQTHPDRYVECNSTNTNGYKVKWSDGSYVNSITGLTQDDFNSIYIKSNQTKANGMWLASPSASNADRVMNACYYGYVDYYSYDINYLGFRPLVCLKSGVQLVDNGDGTCSIK